MPVKELGSQAPELAGSTGQKAPTQRQAQPTGGIRELGNEPPELSGSALVELGSTAGRSFNTGALRSVGSVVDATTALMNLPIEAAGLPPIERPIGGSQSLLEATSGGTLSGAPRREESVFGTEPVQFPAMTFRSIEDVPEELRPTARAFEVVGEALPFFALPLVKGAQLGTKAAKNFLQPIPGNAFSLKAIKDAPTVAGKVVEGAKQTGRALATGLGNVIESARTAPGAFAAGETAAATGAGVAGAFAEAIAPGNTGARVASEVAGGILNPAAILSRTAGPVGQNLRQFTRSFSEEGRKQQAGELLQEMVEGLGEDPSAVAENLRRPQEVPSAPTTAGQRSGSEALIALERKLISESAELGADIRRQTQNVIDDVNLAFREAAGSGDPRVLQNLAQSRLDYWDALQKTSLQIAEQKIQRAAQTVRPNDPQAAQQANRNARTLLEASLKEARAEEKRLWGLINRRAPTQTANTKAAFAGAKGDLLPGEKLKTGNPAITASLKKWAGPRAKVTPTSGELLRLRGRITAEQRRIRGAQSPDWDLHRRLDDIQIGILDDLAEVDAAAVTARQFSGNLHENFSRTAAGTALGRTPTGADRITPELTLERTVAQQGGPARAVATEQLERAAATTPGGDISPVPGGFRLAGIREAEREVIRDLVVKGAIDPVTGAIDPAGLARFRENNKELLARFPELAQTFETAQTVTQQTRDAAKRLAQRNTALRNESAFAKVLRFEDPKRAIGAALDSDRPSEALGSIFQLARRTPAARAGARKVLLDTLFDRATGTDGLISGERLEGLLTGNGLQELARKNGILDPDQIKNVNRIATEAKRLEKAFKSAAAVDEVVGDPNDLFDLLVRITAANLGSGTAVARTSGASLVLAGAATRTARKWLERVPVTRLKDVMAEAVRNPSMMADLLTRPKTQAGRTALDRRINGFLIQAGILNEEDQPQETGN